MRIDAHVHILGDGTSGSGCWLKLKKSYHKLLARIIMRSLGVPASALGKQIDRLYVERLVQMVRESSIDAALILAHEQPHDDAGRPIENFGSFYTPNDYVLSVAREYPDCFIAAISIHPARPDALDELERCIEQGAGMLKLLPNCQNVDCSDPRFTKFWERLANAGLPFLAHTGGELSVPVFNSSFADPATLVAPLECGVTVIAAHCGTRALLWDPHYTQKFLRLIEKYPNLYGDNSGMNTPLRSRYFPDLLAPAVQARIIHGSDLPIPISSFWNWVRGNVSFGDWKHSDATKNMIERDARIKSALGFAPETFERIATLLPKTVIAKLRKT